jgi:hypothetical protein
MGTNRVPDALPTDAARTHMLSISTISVVKP